MNASIMQSFHHVSKYTYQSCQKSRLGQLGLRLTQDPLEIIKKKIPFLDSSEDALSKNEGG